MCRFDSHVTAIREWETERIYVVYFGIKNVDRYNHEVFAKRMFPQKLNTTKEKRAHSVSMEKESGGGKRAKQKKSFSIYISSSSWRVQNILLPLSRLLQTSCIINARLSHSIATHARHSFFYFLFTFSQFNLRTSSNNDSNTITQPKWWKSNIM